jgi:acyl-CoA thioesterase-1
VLILGDSLSAGYGLRSGESWVNLLTRRMSMEGYGRATVNASVSGETTTGGLNRLPHLLATHHPSVVVVELGANDALRGMPAKDLSNRLLQIVSLAHGAGARVLLVGAPLPGNYGEEYAQSIAAAYLNAAKQSHTPLVPSLLAGVTTDERNFQADHLHPTAAAQEALLNSLWPSLKHQLGSTDIATRPAQ